MNPHDDTSPVDPLGEMLRAWSGMVSTAMLCPEVLNQVLGAGGAHGPDPANRVNEVLMQAHFAALAALVRVWSRSAQSLTQTWPVGVWVQTGSATQAADAGRALGRLVDDARAHLRRLSEVALDESLTFGSQMQALGEQLRTVVEYPINTATPRRYARTKP